MKAHIRFLSLLLAAILLLSAAPSVGAVNFVFGDTVASDSRFELYPNADVIDATIVKGRSRDLVFYSNLLAWNPWKDFYYVVIYRGSLAYIENLARQGKEPEVVETFYKNAQELQEDDFTMTVRWNADSRYPVGDYSLVCFLADGLTGQIYEREPPFWTELHVVDEPRAAADFSMWIMMSDGLYEIQEGDVVYAPYPKAFLVFTPEPVPCTEKMTFTLSCTVPDFVKFSIFRNYTVIEPALENLLTRVTVVSGKITHTFWLQTEGNDERNKLEITRGKPVLCVGELDACRVKESDGAYRPYRVVPEWSSSDPSIATVTPSGTVKGLKPGKVTITGTAGRFQRYVEYTVQYHQLPEDTPVTGPTATQPKQAVGHCSVCGKDDAVNVYEPAIFTDTTSTAWYAEHVDRVYDLGLMNGTGAHSFSPDSTLTRAMAATVLYRIAGKPEVTGRSPFPDVSAGQWYTEAVIWAQAKGIVTGYQDGTYRPDRSITREQFAAILYRYMCSVDPELEVPDSPDDFPDADKVQSYAREAMRWAVGEKLINGVAVGNQSFLRPENDATRAQFATIISRFITVLEKYEPGDPAPDPNAPNPDAPAPAQR